MWRGTTRYARSWCFCDRVIVGELRGIGQFAQVGGCWEMVSSRYSSTDTSQHSKKSLTPNLAPVTTQVIVPIVSIFPPWLKAVMIASSVPLAVRLQWSAVRNETMTYQMSYSLILLYSPFSIGHDPAVGHVYGTADRRTRLPVTSPGASSASDGVYRYILEGVHLTIVRDVMKVELYGLCINTGLQKCNSSNKSDSSRSRCQYRSVGEALSSSAPHRQAFDHLTLDSADRGGNGV